MEGIRAFLADPANHTVLIWVGGGITAAAVALAIILRSFRTFAVGADGRRTTALRTGEDAVTGDLTPIQFAVVIVLVVGLIFFIAGLLGRYVIAA